MKLKTCLGAASFSIIILASQGCTNHVKLFEYSSAYYRIELSDTVPFVRYFSVDAMGKGELDHNPVLWKGLSGEKYILHKIADNHASISGAENPSLTLWDFKFDEKNFTLTSFNKGIRAEGIEFRFSKLQNHTTLLGLMVGKNKTRLPALMHFPDMGTMRLESDKPGTIINYDASRKEGENFISVKLPPATPEQGMVSYTFTDVSIYPHFEGAETEQMSGFRRNYLNLFQVNPKLQVLANNSCSDPCAFTLFMSSMLALNTPPLADSLTALDLLRMSIERYLNGMKAYGMFGYNGNWEDRDIGVDNSKSQPYDYLDTYPSLVISACNYIRGSGDTAWARKYYPKIKEWMDRQMARDYDRNGLVEYELSGNSGSWNGVVRPANWWDTIGFGHEDAFSNTLTYNALNLIEVIAKMIGKDKDALLFSNLAEKMKKSYFKTFYNPSTGVIAGWRSSDGRLHDYYFLMVNSMAVYYDLVPEDKVKDVMVALWKKMKEVGFTDFTLGLPGNLVSVRWEDYTHHDPRFGGGTKADGTDAFQRYENGGASLNWTYYTLKAFKKAGLNEPLQQISAGILKSISTGAFQGYCSNSGMTKDWKTWTGECWGYEGFLCDGYLALLAFNPDDK